MHWYNRNDTIINILSMTNILEISNLSYTYKTDWTRKTIQGLKDISLSIVEGESFGFLGHNGAGKTTTMKAILGFIKPTSGNISIFGNPSTDKSALKFVGYLPEQPYFYDYLTVREGLELYGTLAGTDAKKLKSKILEVAETVKLQDRLNSSLRSLSKGLTQRFALAQAIINDPKLLLLDEPFSGLDPLGRIEFRDIFLSLKKQGVALFISSHILSDVEILCDRASILVRGSLKGIYNLKNLSDSKNCSFELGVENQTADKLSYLDNSGAEKILRNSITVFKFNDEKKALSALKQLIELNEKPLFYERHLPKLEDVFLETMRTTDEL